MKEHAKRAKQYARHFAYHNTSTVIDALFMAMCVVSITLSLVFAIIAIVDISVGLELPLLSLGLSGFSEFLGAFPIRAVLLSAAFVVVGVRCADVVANRAKQKHTLLASNTLSKLTLLVFPLIIGIIIGLLTPIDNKIAESDSFGGLQTFKTLKEKYLLTGTVVDVLGDNDFIVRDKDGQFYEITISGNNSSTVEVDEGDFVATIVDQDTTSVSGSETNPGNISTSRPVVQNPTIPGVSNPPKPPQNPPEATPNPDVPATAATCQNDGRTIVDASRYASPIVLTQPNTIYDFKNVSAGRDIRIAGDNIEARNIRGDGARRIGKINGSGALRNAGFCNFDFTYIATEHRVSGDVINPYFKGGTDVNPIPTYTGSGAVIRIIAITEDIVNPLIEDVSVRAMWWSGQAEGNGHIECMIMSRHTGNGYIENPTVRGLHCETGRIGGIVGIYPRGIVTIEDSTFTKGRMPEAKNQAMTWSRQPESATVLYRNNTLDDGMTSYFSTGNGQYASWKVHPNTELSSSGLIVK